MTTSTHKNIPNQTIIIVSALIALLALVYGVFNYQKAFPEVGIDIKISRNESIEISKAFLENRNFPTEGFRSEAIFSSASTAALFLQRELGVERMTELARDSLDLYYWANRYIIPKQKLSYYVKVDPSGKVIGFTRFIDEASPGPKLETATAVILAEAFIRNVLGLDLDQWELVESSNKEQPERRDHYLTYQMRNFKVADAPYRMSITVQGAEIGSFHKYLDIPQEWIHQYKKIRSQNDLFQTIANLFAFLMLIVVFIYLLKHLKARQIPWKTAGMLAIILAMADFLNSINMLPLLEFRLDTTSSYTVFLTQQILIGLLSGFSKGALVLLLVAGGEYLYRGENPFKVSFSHLLSRTGYRSREFFQATLMGYLLAAFHFGFLVFFYVFGEKLGFWAPADIPYSNSISSYLPWLLPLAASLGASLTEELWFRLFGVSFFRKLTKSVVLAVIIPAFMWGFLHSSYAQIPGYVRGVEVGIIGIIAGVVMLRFGIWATLVWHFVIDAVFIGLFLFQSSNTYLMVSGLIVCGALAIPGIWAGIVYLRKRGFADEGEIINQANPELPQWEQVFRREKPVKVEIEPAKDKASYWTPGKKKVALILGIVGMAFIFLPYSNYLGDSYQPTVSRSEAVALAKEQVVEKYAINPDDYLMTVTDIEYNMQFEAGVEKGLNRNLPYLKKFGDLEMARYLLFGEHGAPMSRWLINFQKPDELESFKVSIDKVHGIYDVLHEIPDSLAGAQLTLDSAQVIAEQAFKSIEPDWQKYELVSASDKQQPNRVDHYFMWKTTEPVVAEAKLVRYVNIKGDEVIARRLGGIYVPETWTRREKETTLLSTILGALMIGLLLGMAVYCVLNLGKRLVKHDLRWRNGIIAGAVVFIASCLSWVNNLPTFYWNYNSSNPLPTYYTVEIMRFGMLTIFTSLSAVVLVALAESLARGMGIDGGKSESGANSLNLWRVLPFAGLLLASAWIFNEFTAVADMPKHLFPLSVVESATSYLPWFHDFTRLIFLSIVLGSGLMITQAILFHVIRKSWFRWLIIIITVAVFAGNDFRQGINPSNGEYLWSMVGALFKVLIYTYGAKWLMTGKTWHLIIAAMVFHLLDYAQPYLIIKDLSYQINGWMLIGIAILLIIFTQISAKFRRNTI